SVLSRPPKPQELKVLNTRYDSALKFYLDSPESAKRFLEFGQPENEVTGNQASVAALTVMASLVYNLDEAITRE
ncbi:MAG: hypothetical protein VX438_06010, partial [Planctomycetota bacterium]|nr:hypothetical protein [Planctomycetota bacterium]